MKTKTLTYYDEKVPCKGFLAYETRGAPVVLVAHAWRGQDEFARQKAQKLAKKGYAGFAIDMYGEGICVDNADAPQQMAPFFFDRFYLQKRIRAAADFVRTFEEVNGQKLGAIGFCFGGLCVYELFRSGTPLDVAIAFHGVFASEREGEKAKLAPIAENISGKLLILHGNDDPMVSDEDLLAVRQEMTRAGVDWQLHLFGGTMHAFTNPQANNPEMGTVYSEISCMRAFDMAYQLLASSLLELC